MERGAFGHPMLGVLFGSKYDDARESFGLAEPRIHPLFVVSVTPGPAASIGLSLAVREPVLQRSDFATFELLIQTFWSVDSEARAPGRPGMAAVLARLFSTQAILARRGEVLALLALGESPRRWAATVESWLLGVLWQFINLANETTRVALASLTDVCLFLRAMPDGFLESVPKV